MKKIDLNDRAIKWMHNQISKATFYRNDEGMFRIQHTDEKSFLVIDENTLVEKTIGFDEVDFDKHQFYNLQSYSLADAGARIETTVVHVDDFCDTISSEDKPEERYAKWWLSCMRVPAYMLYPTMMVMKEMKLFCTYEGKRWRVTGSSRLGDLWLHSDFSKDSSYSKRVDISQCSEWSDTPDYTHTTIK